MKSYAQLIDSLNRQLGDLTFQPPVAYANNPLVYARDGFDQYTAKYGAGPKEVLIFGMNPGPWGMAQTGVPFGEVAHVRDWMGIEADVQQPQHCHPKRPVTGMACTRSEVSGRRVWGWAAETFQTPRRFFERFLVLNYCPLIFFDEAGRNITPDKLKKADRTALFDICDQAVVGTVEIYQPQLVIGVGRFAENRCRQSLLDQAVRVGGITHPSPANPKANRGWAALAATELSDLGIAIP